MTKSSPVNDKNIYTKKISKIGTKNVTTWVNNPYKSLLTKKIKQKKIHKLILL